MFLGILINFCYTECEYFILTLILKDFSKNLIFITNMELKNAFKKLSNRDEWNAPEQFILIIKFILKNKLKLSL